jgi:hypothetical protein
MRFVHGIFRLITIVFTLALSVFLLGVGLLAMGDADALRFDIVPLLSGNTLALALVAMGILGLAAPALLPRFKHLASWLLVLWNLGIISILICAFTRSSYRFDGMDDFTNGVYFSLVALASLLGSWFQVRASRTHPAERV